jgi:hypothetical protein
MTATVQARRSTQTGRVMAFVLLLVTGIAVYPGRANAQKPVRAHTATAQVGTFAPVEPHRLVDTIGRGVSAPGPRSTTVVQVTGANSVPSTGVTAVVLTVTVSASTANGYLTAYADGTTRPGTANLVFRTGHAVSDQVYAPVSADGKVTFYNGSSGTLRLIVDITGYFAAQAGAPAGGYVATTPTRTVDTRSGLGGAPVSARGTKDVAVLGHGPVPSTGVSAVAFTISALSPTATGYLSVYAGGTTRPPTANLYLSPGRSIANMAVSMVGSAGTVTIYNGAPSSTQFVVDVTGYFLSGAPTAGGAFVAFPPERDATEQIVPARQHGQTPITTGGTYSPADAVVVNETVTGATTYGYSVVYSAHLQPAGSSLSFSGGPATAGMVTPDTGGYELMFYNGSDGTARFTIDSFGYYISSPGIGAVAGRITDSASHAGVAGVRVRSFGKVDPNSQDPSRDWTYGPTTITASDGTYLLPSMWAGVKYWICFDTRLTPGPPSYTYSGQCWSNKPWPSSDDFNDVPGAALVTVTAGQTTNGIDASLKSGAAGRVAGTVTTTGGDPLAAVDVSVTRTLDQVQVDTTTAADGTYQVPALTPGGYTVCFQATAPRSPTAPYGYVRQCQAETVTAGTTDRVDAHLVAAGGISGRVTNVAGTAVTGVTVIETDKTGSETQSVPVAADGTYTLTALAPGSYRVCFDAQYALHPPTNGYLSQCYRNQPWSRQYDATLPSTLTPVTVSAGTTTTGIDATLVTAGAVSGTVTDTAGHGVSGITVYAFDPAGRRAGSSGTAADGTYAVPLLRPTVAYRVCFSDVQIVPVRPPYASQCWKDIPWSGNLSALPAGATAVTVTSGGTHSGIDATLTR